ncbi:metallophosphoesterase [Desulfofalx alkaliphila]|uniref:metallophosphoesterase n=1 Tax=Desulfofalx alkaliphila TaxID=105483 RepID=UPI0004E133B7|nr:metallophosphoesterase [Desulfofalx alkaliphila]
MKLFAISDVHLSFDAPVDPNNWDAVTAYKPMDECSIEWKEHYKELYYNWCDMVGDEDVVLMPGDISWATKLNQTVHDMNYLGMLPGLIIAVPGNHDYWWQSLTKVRAALPANMQVIQNDHIILDNIAICGTRGWVCPNNGGGFTEHDEKIYKREIIRLENSLSSVKQPVEEIIVLMHYMPTNEKHERSGFIEVLEKYKVSTVLYGHLHSRAQRYRLPDTAWGINFHLVSADYVKFTPVLIRDTNL